MNKKQLPIGIFDSGLGGLTVLKQLQKVLPNESFIYIGDTAHLPYGNKSPESILTYSKQIGQFFINQKVKLIIIACNTASSIAFNTLQQTFKVPIIDVITPIQEIVNKHMSTIKVGVIGTYNTVSSRAYSRAINLTNNKAQIFEKACPLFVPIIEEGLQEDAIASLAVKKYLTPLLNKKIDLLILGCTHYPLMKKTIQANIPKTIQIIDSADSTALYLKRYLKQNMLLSCVKSNQDRIIITDQSKQFKKFANVILDRSTIKIELLKLF